MALKYFPLSKFPNLVKSGFKKTSDADTGYNCYAHALHSDSEWCDDFHSWPDNVPREYSIDAYAAMIVEHGFEECDSNDFEKGHEKIVLFAKDGLPQHAARQLSKKKWTSKLGRKMDIEHEIDAFKGSMYGEPVRYFKRKT